MSNTSSISKLEQNTFCLITLTVSVVAFTLSTYYFRNGNLKLNFVLFPQMAVYILLGFFHAYNVWSLENVVSRQQKNILMLFCYFLAYTAWYNIVLLPESGLGYIEWIIVFVVLTTNLINEICSKKISNPFMGQRPLVLVFFGAILFILKIIFFYLFKDNIYDQFILHNKLARLFVVLFSIVGLILLLQQLYKHITNRLEVKIDTKKAWKTLKDFLKFLFSIIKKGIMLLFSMVSLPVFIIIIASVVIICLGISFATAKFIYDNILEFIEPLLEKLASTGENSIHPSVPYYTLQTISMTIILFYTIWIEKRMSKNLENAINERVTQEILARYSNEDNNILNKSTELLIKNRNFNEQLRIFGSNSAIKETINYLENNIED